MFKWFRYGEISGQIQNNQTIKDTGSCRKTMREIIMIMFGEKQRAASKLVNNTSVCPLKKKHVSLSEIVGKLAYITDSG